METPTNLKNRPVRAPTPKMSERKKALFSSSRRSPIREESDDGNLDGIDILTPSKNSTFENRFKRMTRSSLKKFSEDLMKLLNSETFLLSEEGASSSKNSSPDSIESSETTRSKSRSSKSTTSSITTQSSSSSDELRNLFKETLNLRSTRQKKPFDRTSLASDKSPEDQSSENFELALSPVRKQRKLDHSSGEKNDVSPATATLTHIPAKNFYSKPNILEQRTPTTDHRATTTPVNKEVKHRMRSHLKRNSRLFKPDKGPRLFSKGVAHKIKRFKSTKIPIERLLESIKSAKLRAMSSKFMSKETVEKVHNILRTTQNPIKMARPLQIHLSEDELSEEDLSDEENIDNSIEGLGKRKFFKSRGSKKIRNKFNVMGNLQATIKNGKIHILSNSKKPKFDVNAFSILEDSFEDEHQTINKIIENLDETQNTSLSKTASNLEEVNEQVDDEVIPLLEDFIDDDGEFASFRMRIPYNTDDPAMIERQHLLLDFLIQNNICTEENFNIFIADPNNHKEEAAQILDNIPIIIASSSNDLDNNTVDDSESNHFCIERLQTKDVTLNDNSTNLVGKDQETDIDVHNNNEQRLFPIFYPKNNQPIVQQSTRKLKRRRVLGVGSDQYQIDAGQKEFGARQCPGCGLLYTIHEPEEEELHKLYHNSLNVLKFQGWIDEDLVKEVFDWGTRGRIICVSNLSHTKHQQRLKEVLEIVDREIGYNAVTLPTQYNAYIAASKNNILGICLVHPISKASRYLVIDDIEYASEETYDVKCGVSRIWVAPFRRRSGIATKLIEAVKTSWIPGCPITMNEIAISPPTDDGRAFAQKISGRKDFLIYQTCEM